MATLLKEVSTITAKGQTTVPKSVRQALGVDSGDRIAFVVDENGVTVERADAAEALRHVGDADGGVHGVVLIDRASRTCARRAT